MLRFASLFLCAVSLFVVAVPAQTISPSVPVGISPLQIPAGAVVDFQLQTRMKAAAADVMDALPKGTMLRVKLLDPIDSTVDHDGAAFHGQIVSSVERGNRVVIHANAEVHGLFALLRSATHPEGFQYQLLVTGLVDRGQSYTLTAFLDPDSAATTSEFDSLESLPR